MNSIARRLAPLASRKAQERYIRNATPAEYYVPEELLEDAFDVVRLVESGHPSALDVSDAARMEIRKLRAVLEVERQRKVTETAESAEALLASPEWQAIVAQAEAFVRAMEFDLDRWEATE